MLSAAIAPALLALAVSAAPLVPLSRYEPEYVQTRAHGEEHSYERGMLPADADALIALRMRVAGELVLGVRILRVPGQPGRFLVEHADLPEGGEFGKRLSLYEKTERGFRQLSRSRPQQESYVFEPVFFTGGGRVLILAEVGTEYSWGVAVYEVAGDSLRHLGDIDAAVPGRDNEEDPTPFARVFLDGARVEVHFDTDLVLRPGSGTGPMLRKPVVFRQEGRRFVPVRKRDSSAPSAPKP